MIAEPISVGALNRPLTKSTKCVCGKESITVCERWRESFENFLADMGERPHGMSLERINNDGNYEPSNCRWATKTEQNNNTRQNVFVEFNGLKKTINQWSKIVGIKHNTIRNRIRLGWDIFDALTVPVRNKGELS